MRCCCWCCHMWSKLLKQWVPRSYVFTAWVLVHSITKLRRFILRYNLCLSTVTMPTLRLSVSLSIHTLPLSIFTLSLDLSFYTHFASLYLNFVSLSLLPSTLCLSLSLLCLSIFLFIFTMSLSFYLSLLCLYLYIYLYYVCSYFYLSTLCLLFTFICPSMFLPKSSAWFTFISLSLSLCLCSKQTHNTFSISLTDNKTVSFIITDTIFPLSHSLAHLTPVPTHAKANRHKRSDK